MAEEPVVSRVKSSDDGFSAMTPLHRIDYMLAFCSFIAWIFYKNRN